LPLDVETAIRIVPDEQATSLSLVDVPAFIIVKQKTYLRKACLREWQTVLKDGPWMLLASPVVALDDAHPSK
jgi:hypothetical protein